MPADDFKLPVELTVLAVGTTKRRDPASLSESPSDRGDTFRSFTNVLEVTMTKAEFIDQIAATTVPKFSAGSQLKASVKGGRCR